METMLSHLATMTVLAGLCCGLQVGPVELEPGRTIIYHHLGTTHGNNVVKCPYTLDDGEVLELVTWELETLNPNLSAPLMGRLTLYESGENPLVEGLLEGIVARNRTDYNLEFKNITYDLWAKYNCTVKLTDGTMKTAVEDIIVLDTSGLSVNLNTRWCGGGRYTVNVKPMFPAPVVEAKVVSDRFNSFGYVVEPNNTDVNYHDNGSVSIDNRPFDVMVDLNTPEDAQLVITVYVVRHNGERFHPSSFSFSIQEKLGCEELEVGKNQTVTYNSQGKNCYGQLIPPNNETLKAKVRCKDAKEDMSVDTKVQIHECVQLQDQGNMTYTWQEIDSGRDYVSVCELELDSSATTTQLPPVAMMVLVTAILTYNQLF